MPLYNTMKVILSTLEQVGSIRKVHLREKTEYMPEGFSVSGETRDGNIFRLEFDVTDKEENCDQELE